MECFILLQNLRFNMVFMIFFLIPKKGKRRRKRNYDNMQNLQLCETLLPSNQAALSTTYREAIQRALRMPQCRLIPFFGIFLRDLYAIVNDTPSVLMTYDGEDKDKLEVSLPLYIIRWNKKIIKIE